MTPTIPLAAAETALRNLPSTITRDDETISLQAALDALRGVAGEAWQPIETAPRDGTLFLSRNADHPNSGISPTIRHVVWRVDDKTGETYYQDMGAWLFARDLDASFGIDSKPPFFPFSVAPDKYNKSVVLEWTPLTAYRQKRGQDDD